MANIRFVKKIGSGEFGDVFLGLLKQDQTSIDVAIKKLKNNAPNSEQDGLLKEADFLKECKHPNLIKIFGVCYKRQSLECIVMEYMNSGNLLNYLKESRTNNCLNYQKAIEISFEIAKGCEYLEEHKKVHRDLAARNCLISKDNSDNLKIKIGDFGLALNINSQNYLKLKDNKLLPVRWMAPEALDQGKYSNKSDIWSFGILLWEIFSSGSLPYPGMSNYQVIEYIKSGGVHRKPKDCPNELSEILSSCLAFECNNRPSFGFILEKLRLHLENISSYADNSFIELNYLPINKRRRGIAH